ncbi:DUF2807 domain-containing protein [Riemerella anatipestifer]|nr:DUF2807 domain-containing protein [Riemerella anatipestifer]MDY3533755.1 DUF2807 domain-containing protein [Riemerella anatipestifer]MDY3535628.1 DUF2807 domain-containing protein [Riemerella anatipestifer]
MKHYIYLLVSVFLWSSCGKITPEGEIKSEDRPLEVFNKLELEGKYRLFFTQGEENFVNVETYPNLISNLKIKVEDSTLKIIENRPTGNVDFYTVTVYSKTPLKQISISDSVEMNVSGDLKTPNLKINLKNQGKFIGAIKTSKAEVQMTEKSRANFSGVTKEAVLKISDTASIIAPYWTVDYFDIQSKNGNYAEINTKEEISGKVENTAKLVYYGNPIRKLKIDKDTKVENKEKP